jgi:outer membrane protein assembly factor BamA
MPPLTKLLIVLAACGQPGQSTLPRPVEPLSSCPVELPVELDDAATATLAPTDKIASVAVHGAELGDLVLETKVGLFDPFAIRGDLHTLWRLSVASRVAVTATPQPDGYAVVFDVTPARPVIRVEFEGMTRADVPQLALLEGTLHDRGRLARLVASTEASLRDHGYAHASLRASTRTTCAGVVVRIAGMLGPRYRAGTMRVIGASEPIAAAELSDDFGNTNAPGKAFHRSSLDAALVRLVAREQARGFFDAAGRVYVVGDDETHQIDGVLWIDDGPRYRIDFEIVGGTQATSALIDAALGPAKAKEDLDAFDRAFARAVEQVAALGYNLTRSDAKQGDVLTATLLVIPRETSS